MSETESDILTELRCFHCGIKHAMPKFLMEQRRQDGKPMYCPNGHSYMFIESRDSQLAKAKKESAAWEAEAQRLIGELDKVRDELIAAKRKSPQAPQKPWWKFSKE